MTQKEPCQKIKGTLRQGKGMISKYNTKGTLRQNIKGTLDRGKNEVKARHKRDLTSKL